MPLGLSVRVKSMRAGLLRRTCGTPPARSRQDDSVPGPGEPCAAFRDRIEAAVRPYQEEQIAAGRQGIADGLRADGRPHKAPVAAGGERPSTVLPWQGPPPEWRIVPHRGRFRDFGAAMDRYPPIAGHGLVGDLQTAALVSSQGVVGWFAAPRFDSPRILPKVEFMGEQPVDFPPEQGR